MSTTKFSTITFPISTLIGQIQTGQIALPELQRPFVWERVQVRDLFDSLYRGYPTGHFLFWQARADLGSVPIGIDGKQASASFVVVDGQQRLTSLYAVFTGGEVLNKKFEQTSIRIAFNPLAERFEVTTPAIEKDVEWVSDISLMLSNDQAGYSFISKFVQRLMNEREVSDELADRIAAALERLGLLKSYTFNAIQLSNELPIEEVSEIFVRVNSKGTPLNQADFILTLMSVYWDAGRKELEKFCQEALVPAKSGESPFNWFIEPSPDQLLRVAIGLGHRRAQLRYAYELLRGKDLETGIVSDETRQKHFEALASAQDVVLNLTNWSEFLKALQQAGFRSGKMITSKNSIVYSYLIFLLGRHDHGIDYPTLRDAIARWFSMVLLTSRYTGSPETQVEKDIRRFAEAKTGEEFIATVDQIIASNLTNDFWEAALPDQLAWSGGFIPAVFAYHAALNLLGAKVLFSKLTVHELLDPALKTKKKGAERHHLFPKNYLAKPPLNIKQTARVNQAANYALVEWPDNAKISDDPPASYFPDWWEKRVSPYDADRVRFWHALPVGWEHMEYDKFLEERRRLMSKVIRAGFEKLAHGVDPIDPPPDPKPSVDELVAEGESLTVEFKASAIHSYKADVPGTVVTNSILKTVAAFLNSEGGTLVIGVADDGVALGLDHDLQVKGFDLDHYENFLMTLFKERLDALAATRCQVRFEKFDGITVCIVDVRASTKPVFASLEKGKSVFFVRFGNSSRQLENKETLDYVAERWNLS